MLIHLSRQIIFKYLSAVHIKEKMKIMKLKKGYLTAEELEFIVSKMIGIEGAVNREILKVGLVAQFVIEDLEEFESCNDIYNKLVETEDINLIYSVHNYDVIDKLVKEEVGIDIIKESLELVDCHRSIIFEIFAHFRHRYAPDVTHCQEHWFTLALPAERDIVLTEHSQYQWLDAPLAAKLTKSASNQQAIEEFVI